MSAKQKKGRNEKIWDAGPYVSPGSVRGNPGPGELVHLKPFDVVDGQIQLAADGSLCAVLTNGRDWLSLRFPGTISITVGQQLVEKGLKLVKVH